MGASYELYAEVRDSLGMTDYAVAKKANIGKSTFSDWKSGRSCPKSDKMERIASAMGVSVDLLLGKEGLQEFILTTDDTALLLMYKELNDVGKRKVREYVSDLYDRYRNV